MKYDAFISYRRKSGTHQATALKEALENRRHKGCVFMDTYTRKGGPFPKELSETLKESCNLVVVISAKDCFIPKEGEEDYYLREISDALGQGKNIVPVYYDEVKYEDIEGALKNSPYNMKNFPKHQAVFYHNDNPEGSISQIDSLLKTEEDILNEQLKSLSEKRTQIRQELLYLKEDNSGKCPICQSDYDATMTYCQKCAYKFFDELDESVAEKNEKIQEKARKKKHKEIWEMLQQGGVREKYLEAVIEKMKDQVEELSHEVESKREELMQRDQELEETKATLRDTILRMKDVKKESDSATQLLPNVKKLIKAIGNTPKTRYELMHIMSLVSEVNLRMNYITPAIKRGYVKLLYGDITNHPRQQYKLTSLGKKMLDEMKQEMDVSENGSQT